MEKSFDKSVFLNQFKQETEEHLQNLNKGLLLIEKDPENKEMMEEIFRVAHTLKGAATMMGMTDIRDVAHKCEDILDKARHKQIRLNEKIIDLLFESLDAIQNLLNSEIKGEKTIIDVPLLLQKLIDSASEKPEVKEEIKEREKEIIEVRGPLKIEETIRVAIDKLDDLINMGGELVISKIKFDHGIQELRKFSSLLEEFRLKRHLKFEEDSKDLIEILKDKFEKIFQEFLETQGRMEVSVNNVQEQIMKIRMLPLSTVFSPFPRMIRDLSRQEGKEIDIEISGEDTELDKSIIDRMKDPLMHILRNCVDHGIENPFEREKVGKPRKGKIKLSAYQKGDRVQIEIFDDGKGLDKMKILNKAIEQGIISSREIDTLAEREIFDLIFSPGFSTKGKVSLTSGRGVGLDAVKDTISHLKGSIEVNSIKGQWCKFTIKLPLTLAITDAILIKSSKEIFAIPLSSLERVIKIKESEIDTVGTKEAIQVRGHTIPLIRLDEILNIENKSKSKKESYPVIIVSSGEKNIALMIDELVGKQEIVIKNLGDFLGKTPNIAGATILGNGDIILIIDIPSLIEKSKTVSHKREEEEKTSPLKILAVEDSLTAREVEKSILESAGYKVEVAVDGLDALEKIKRDKFNLIITDIQMPKMDGFELIEKIREKEEYKDLPIIVVTTKESDEDRKRGMEVGADAYIVKSSFEQKQLLQSIERLIG